MAEIVNFYEMKLLRFSKEMREIVEEIVKIEKKWVIGATTIESARKDLMRIEEWIKDLTDKAEELNLLGDKYSIIKFRLDNSRAKVIRALRGEWGE